MAVNARQSKVGIAIATSGSWGYSTAIATAVGAGNGHYVRDDLKVQLRVNRSYLAAASQDYITAVQLDTDHWVDGVIPAHLHYNDAWQNVLWRLALGATAYASSIGTSLAYAFEPTTSKSGLYATIVRDKVQHVSEVSGAKFTGFELTVGDNGRMQVDWTFVGNTEKSDSVINTTTQINALTFPTLGLRAFFDDCVIRLNAQTAGALGAGDTMKFTGMKVVYHQSVDTRYVGGQLTLVEPIEDAAPEITVDLTFARYDATSHAFFAAHRDGTKYKADITFTGPTIDGISNNTIQLQFPSLDVKAYVAPVPGGAAQVEPQLTLVGVLPSSAPTGMSGISTPFRVLVVGSASLAQAPLAVTYTAPATLSRDLSLTPPTLTWTAAIGATSYDVYFDTANPPTSLVSTSQVGLSFTPAGPLVNATTYFWKVVAKNASGSTPGAIWQFKTVLGAEDSVTVLTTTSIGTQNNFNVGDLSNINVLRCNNASLLTITGLTDNGATPGDGQLVYVESVGAGQVDIANQSASSTATNRMINNVTGSISLAAGSGRALLVYDNTTGRWRVVDHEQGAWIDVPFNAGDFTASTGTATVASIDIREFRYWLKGRTLSVSFEATNIDLSSTPTGLKVKIPGGFLAQAPLVETSGPAGSLNPQTTWEACTFQVLASDTGNILLRRATFVNLIAGTDILALYTTSTFEVQ